MPDAAESIGRSIEASAFACAMASLGPFEPRPVVAVAVSGGPDSVALSLLMHEWARMRGGSAIAITVDHGLRPESTEEARRVGDWLSSRGIAHVICRWRGEKPSSGVQSAARDARYRLLERACAKRGILHLAAAHHADDQAETVLFRKERGSGAQGLAGMTASRSLGSVRLIRPLLAWRKADLVATCVAAGQDFMEDPSNRAPRFARTKLRARLAAEPRLEGRVLSEAEDMAAERIAAQQSCAVHLAGTVEIRPDGGALLDRTAFAAHSAQQRSAVLGAVLRTVGGGIHPSPDGAVKRLDARLAEPGFRGAGLAGCVIRPWAGRILICREMRGVEPPIELIPGEWRVWDGRFAARIEAGETGLTLGALGAMEFASIRNRGAPALPSVLGAVLPAMRRGEDVIAVPSLGWAVDQSPLLELGFRPHWPLSSETFTVVKRGSGIIFVTGV